MNIHTERSALYHRIGYMFHHLSLELRERDRDVFSRLPYNVNTEYFHEARMALIGEFDEFEKEGLGRTMKALKTSLPLEEVRDLHQLLEETLAYWDMMPAMASVEELLTLTSHRGHLVEDVTPEKILPKEGDENYWLLTKEGYLEFHGGGYLRNEYGPISSFYNGHDSVGSRGIETGLMKILNYGDRPAGTECNGKCGVDYTGSWDRDEIIELMLDSGLNYYVNSGNINERDNWYWDLKENQEKGKSRRIRLPDEIRDYYAQFEPGWKMSDRGFIGADYTDVKDAGVKYHVGVDWVWRCNNRNETVGHPVLSVTDGKVEETGFRSDLGNFIRIECSDGARIDYFHLDSVLSVLKAGNSVVRGQLIGNAGDTGSGEAHLHIAKSYTSAKDAKDKEYSEIVELGHELNDSEYLHLYSKETGDPGERAYVRPPKPLE